MKRSLWLVGLILLPVLISIYSCQKSEKAYLPSGPKMIVLGFDGVDPIWMNRWMSEGKLPNLARLKEIGAYHELKSTIPPQSPVAWASFATGTNPGGHGIYDFVKRVPADYMPEVATMDLQPPEFLLNLYPTQGAYGKETRGGVSFWKVAADKGIHSTLLSIPYSFPPENVTPGRMLSGLGTPDMRGTNSTFTYLASDLTPDDLVQPIGGGKLQKVNVINNEIATFIEGMSNPAKNGERLTVPLYFSIRDDRSVEVRLEGKSTILQPGSWSPWMSFRFKVTPFLHAAGICRFYLFTSEPEFRLYMTPLCIDPANPYMPISYPESFSKELFERVGYFKTVGWIYDTSALNEERLGEAQFIEDMKSIIAGKEKIFYSELDRHDWDLFIGVFTATDRAAHMFYRFLDPEHPMYDPVKAAQYGDIVEWTYRQMDRFVGEVMDKYVDDRTTLIVLSDHGFHSFRRGFNTNTWLAQNGYLVFQGMEKLLPGQQIPKELYPKGDFFPKVNWSKTKAYALGTGQIYINLRGRESRGIVNPGADYDALLEQIVQGLMTVTDPLTSQQVFSQVYKAKEVYSGEFAEKAPDLQLGFAEGYRTSAETMLGGIPPELIISNMRNWSGDHSASAMEETSGILFCNRPIAKEDPAIIDIAPTVLEYFGLQKPPVMEGSSILNASGNNASTR